MAIISYSVSGEGRGHAARARVVLDKLRHNHQLIVYCYGDASAMLQPICREWGIELRQIPGLRFAYDALGRLSRVASATRAIPFLAAAPEWIFRLARMMERDRTDLALVDFEPLLPRAAQLAGIPSIALDHQQFLIACDLSSLPTKLARQANMLATLSRPFYQSPICSIISSFFFPPLRPEVQNVRQVGVLLRAEVEEASPTTGDHLVAYVRRRPPAGVMSALRALRHPVRIYGLDRRGRDGHLLYQEIDARTFASDLASSRGLITTAGNQVVGEALSLGKPVFAYPEPGNIEQQINGHYLSQSGAGVSLDASRVDVDALRLFLDQRDHLASRIDQRRMNGNPLALQTIDAATCRAPAKHRYRSPRPAPAGAGFQLTL